MKNSIQIKTDSDIGSDERIVYYLYEADKDTECGDIYIKFSDPPTYKIESCTEYVEFTTAFPSEKDKVVTIFRVKESGSNSKRIVVQVNDKEMLDVVVSGDVCTNSEWKALWGRDDKPAFIYFPNTDSSDFWRFIGKISFLISTQYY